MKHNEGLTIRTDLAIEAKDLFSDYDHSTKDKTISMSGLKVHHVWVDEAAAETLNKRKGHYITIETNAIKKNDPDQKQNTSHVLKEVLQQLLGEKGISQDSQCLVVGLGNNYVTPDALGPSVISKLLITNHLFEYHPEYIEDHQRPVAAISPGVMGVTGIETSDVIKGVVNEMKPDFLLAIDALASRSVERVYSTIQLSDAGINPGSGIGNKRKELSEDVYGIPVISIGVPTVVDAVTITSDTIDFVFKHFGREFSEKDQPKSRLAPAQISIGEKNLTESDLPEEHTRKELFGMIGGLEEDEKRQLIQEVLTPLGHNLMVTPKEVDAYIHELSKVISDGINQALHEQSSD
ncbi:GPR endopeptidase Aspartic peptidase. MEROPS family A25 [Pelagirhabdus alkalitolerans]|uniref:Germination protease n=1 Tax=Pelagirhabdus alkalitolerans TaxID=1612202 RepID=A0A1G6HUD1_9BACI|nr:GPR endopeptidase [Pelagirhabdus alkalitolerans]SDB97841.1 GPR endopeptidase Aspartic peptidase. MEROPS family A25 [Pelagirhabdus alkalitolerans]